MLTQKPRQPVPGTTIFDGEQARKGYALNKMCYSFNSAANSEEFVRDEDGALEGAPGRSGMSPRPSARLADGEFVRMVVGQACRLKVARPGLLSSFFCRQ